MACSICNKPETFIKIYVEGDELCTDCLAYDQRVIGNLPGDVVAKLQAGKKKKEA